MDNLTKTQREFKNVETGFVFGLYTDQSDGYHLIIDRNQGGECPAIETEVNGFYIAANTGATIKLNTGKTVQVDTGSFYNMKEGEVITHRKFTGFRNFRKV